MKKQFPLFCTLLMVATTLIAGANKPLNARIIDVVNARKSIEIGCNEFEPTFNDGISKNSFTHREYGLKKTKSTNVLKQRLDSTVAPLNYKELSVYNTKGQNIKYTSYNWSIFNNVWVGNTQEEYGYDQYGFNNFYSYSNWNNITNSFVVGITKEQSFNKLGYETSYSEYRLNLTTNEMQGVQKVETVYDATDINVISANYYDWNLATKDWDLTENDVIEYDASGNRTVGYINRNDTVVDLFRTFIVIHYEFDKNNFPVKEEEYDWSDVTGQLELAYKTEYFFIGNQFQKWFSKRINGAWQYTSRFAITYRPDSRPEGILAENWDNKKSVWVSDYKDDNTFNDLNQNTSWMTQDWDTISNSWIPNRKKELTYQTSGIRETYLESKWETTANKWQGRISTVQKNDDNGNLLKYVALIWDVVNLRWYGRANVEFTHNYNYSSDQILSFMSPEEHPNMVLTLTGNEWKNNGWVFKNKADFYYSEQDVTGIKETLKNGISVYPNPAKSEVTVETDGANGLFEVFNLQGSKVLFSKFSSGNKISISSLNKGAYLYKLTCNGVPKTGKLIKE